MVFISASNKHYTIEENENVSASIISVAKNRFVVIRNVIQRQPLTQQTRQTFLDVRRYIVNWYDDG